MMLFQIQTKFRDEFRPQYGTIRPREFLMKDCYSFDIDKTSSLAAYNAMVSAYHKICQEIGLDYQVVEADSGSIGGNHSHEFHALSDTGMDTLLIHPESNYAINTEKFDPDHCPYAKDELIERQGIEIGHCFHLGTTYSKTLNACFTDRDGEEKHVSMGCYGIGVSRLIGAIIEQYHDDNGIRWPASVAPYDVVVLNLRTDDSHHSTISEDMYQKLRSAGLNVLLDDRNTSVGQKLNEADLIGIPWQCIIGPKSLENKKCEWKNRHTDVTKLMPFGQWPKELTSCA
jgi:prolyl-tRNA synthetase